MEKNKKVIFIITIMIIIATVLIVKVIAENGLTNIYSIDIQKAAYNKKIEIIASVAGVSALLIVSLVIYLKKKNNKRKEYLEG